jgi:hypothetical protein
MKHPARLRALTDIPRTSASDAAGPKHAFISVHEVMAMDRKITNRLAEAVHTVSRGRQLDTASSALYECVARELVAIDAHGEQTVTASGTGVAAEFERKSDTERTKRRAAARARSQVMSSLGLVRTRAGGWE